MKSPKLGIVIPVHNQMHVFKQCMGSIFTFRPSDQAVERPIRIYILDNGSTEQIEPGSLQDLWDPAAFDVEFTRYPKNVGVTQAWNDGLRKALLDDCDIVCISNSDVIYGPKAIEHCVGAVWRHGLGLCWPFTNQRGPVPADFRARSQELSELDFANPNSIVDTGGFAGWSFFLSRATVEKVGYFDPQFTLWYQDTDYHNRLHEHGIPHGEVRNCLIHHFESVTIKGLDRGFEHQGWRARDAERYAAKYPRKG
ncbi:MAG: glycosyltransferase family 2 protein [Planctomycetota bacterium]|nr:glycosyltransferase family 2 protein [Planctomycetota bacterium]